MNPFGDLLPIDLDTMNETAELMLRYDAKYLVPTGLLPRLAGSFGPDVRVLEMGGRRGFTYETTYFDTRDLRTYRDHVMGRRRRFKVRHRRYVDSVPVAEFVEVKLRGARDTTSKERWPSALDGGRLSPGDESRVSSIVAERYGAPVGDALRRTLVTRFVRTTVFDPASSERLTIDTDISVESPDGRTVAFSDGHALVEVKSGDTRSHGHVTLASLGLRPRSVSKYCIGLALTGGARANEWRPVIRLLAPENADA